MPEMSCGLFWAHKRGARASGRLNRWKERKRSAIGVMASVDTSTVKP
jgi:hypothetical protein